MIKKLTLVSSFAALLFVQEQVLTFMPNFQLTFMLIILFSRFFKTKITLAIIFTHVFLDLIFYGGPLLLLGPAMIVSYSLIPITLNTIFKKAESTIALSLLSILYGLIYSWVFIIPMYILYNIPIIPYLIADIPFEISLVLSNFTTMIILYFPLSRAMKMLHH